MAAIEGPDEAFRCAEILHRPPVGDPKADYRADCVIAQAMSGADLAWRKALAAKSIANLKSTVERTYPGSGERTRRWFSES